jgi:hypothetical protein
LLLNVSREASADTLATPELAERLPIGDRATQQRVAELEAEGRMSDRGGGTNRWRLAPTEPREPVYSADVAAAKRRRRRAYAAADRVFVYAIGPVSAAGISMAYHVFFLFVRMDAPVVGRPMFRSLRPGSGWSDRSAFWPASG